MCLIAYSTIIFDMAIAVVSGGAGFIGSHLQDHLIDRGYYVVVIDNFSTGKKSNLNRKSRVSQIDLLDKPSLVQLIDDLNPEFIFHLAAISNVKDSLVNPSKCHDVNVNGSLNLLEAAVRSKKLKSFVYASSAAVYGDIDDKHLPIKENKVGLPLSTYGLTKKVFEDYLAYFSSKYGFNGVSLRKANVYGSRQSHSSEGGVISIFLDRIKKDLPVNIYGDGSHTRDYVYVKDVIDAYLKAALMGKPGVYNISNCQEISTMNLYQIITKILGVKGLPKLCKPRVGDIYRSCLNNRLANEKLGWKPIYDIEAGLKDMLNI